MSSDFYNNAVFWVEVDRISPNPYQPRREFDDEKIASLADSIRQYGVLQPLTVTRKETQRADGGISVDYELIAGERRLRASKLAGVPQVPVIIRATEESDKVKLELAIIENLQREDLNPIDRAQAFKQLVDEFNLTHAEVAKKVGKSREYVSNTLRLLGLPDEVQRSLVAGNISEGHARPLLMLGDRPDERDTLFAEILEKKLTVRESERIARRIATDKARKQDLPPELLGMEKRLSEELGTRVQIEQRANGGKVHIDYFSEEDLQRLLVLLAEQKQAQQTPAAAEEDAIATFNDAYTPAPTLPPLPDMSATPTQEVGEDTSSTSRESTPELVLDKMDEQALNPLGALEAALARSATQKDKPAEPVNPFMSSSALPRLSQEPMPSEKDFELPPLPPLSETPKDVSVAPTPPVSQSSSNDDIYTVKNFAL